MAHIWFQDEIDLAAVNAVNHNTLMENIGIVFTKVGDDYLQATMPVNERTHQPAGLLHGGASAALVETVGSIAGWLCVDPTKKCCVGLELNCNHVRGKRDGIVTATAKPFHIGRSTHVWEVKITDEDDRLVCIGRLTLAVVDYAQPKM